MQWLETRNNPPKVNNNFSSSFCFFFLATHKNNPDKKTRPHTFQGNPCISIGICITPLLHKSRQPRESLQESKISKGISDYKFNLDHSQYNPQTRISRLILLIIFSMEDKRPTFVYASPESWCKRGREPVPTAAILRAKSSKGTSNQTLIPFCMYFLMIQIKDILIYPSDTGIWPYQKKTKKKKKKKFSFAC